MNYIIVIDNNKENVQILKGLIQLRKKAEFLIASYWTEFSIEEIETIATSFCESIEEYLNEQDNKIHLIIDLLLTKTEEENVKTIAERLISRENGRVASGIRFANKVLEIYHDRVYVSFMSKWLSLDGDIPINKYNGIIDNVLWQNRKVQSVFNPITDDHVIIDKELQVPKFEAKTAVGAIVNMAFDVFK